MQGFELQTSDLTFRLQELVNDELAEDENIEWIGKPIPTRFALKAIPHVLVGLIWIGFALYWAPPTGKFKLVPLDNSFDLFTLIGYVSIIVGMGIVCSPVWMLWKARRTAYVLTNKRAILFDGVWSTEIRSYWPANLKNLRRTQNSDGSGDLIFDRELNVDNDGKKKIVNRGFIAIRNVKKVEERVRQISNPESQAENK